MPCPERSDVVSPRVPGGRDHLLAIRVRKRAPAPRSAILCASSFALCLWAACGAAKAESPSIAEALALPREPLNVGLPPTADPPDLETPQATLENFLDSAERGDFLRAARSLDLGAIPPARQVEVGADLARQLRAVMEEQVWFHWTDIPDRPDGRPDPEGRSKGEMPDASATLTNIRIFTLIIGEHDYEIRLHRVRPAAGPPVWVFARQTVAHIPTLFHTFGPSRLELALPRYFRRTKFLAIALWQWIGFALTLAAGVFLGWLVQRGIVATLRRRGLGWGRAVLEAFHGPGALTVGLWATYALAGRFLALARPILNVLEPAYIAVAVICLVWFLQRLIGHAAALLGRPFESRDSDEANVVLTRIAVARHAIAFVVLVGGIGFALSRFEWVQQVGSTLLASAGVVGLILGIAAQRVLGNLCAGLLLAITQPVKTGDAILYEGTFGWIEEIGPTYLVIRSWDLRRIVVPISYFLDRPFENWSRGSQSLMLPLYFHADHRVDVERLREELKAILEASPDWDKAVPPILQVTEVDDRSIQLRALCSAANPTASWNLRCQVRERLLAFLRELDGGRYLPRTRMERVDVTDARDGAPPPAPANGSPDRLT